MANYQSLKAAINAVIKANGNKEITGTVLNEVLLAMVNSLGAGYQFAGVATPSTNPGTPDQKVFYIASQAGTYTNFNGAVVSDGIAIFEWNGTWTTETLDLPMAGQVQSDWTETDTTKKSYIKHKPNIPPSANVDPVPMNGSPNAVASGGVYNAIKAITDFLNNGYYFVGIAGTSMVPDSVTQYGIFYIASDGGTYTNFLNGDDEPLILYQGLNILYKDVEDDGWNYFEVFKFSDFVDTTQQQSLSTQQKAQARTNIAAVSYDQQSLSADQQVQAQNNMIGKAYNAEEFSGLGKKVLAKNIIEVSGVNKNVMMKSFFNAANTVYVIQYDYTLGENITIPAGCTLEFDGGSISGGGTGKDTLTGADTVINAPLNKIFGTSLTLAGTWASEGHIRWFGASEDAADNTQALTKTFCSFKNAIVDYGVYYFGNTIEVSCANTIKGEDLYSDNILRYNGNGVALHIENGKNLPYITIDGITIQYDGENLPSGYVFKPNTTAIDTTRVSSTSDNPLKMRNSWIQGFEKGINVNTAYYNSLENTRIENVRYPYTISHTNGLKIVNNRFLGFDVAIRIGADGPVVIDGNSFEIFSYGILATNSSKIHGSLTFTNNYVEGYGEDIYTGYTSNPSGKMYGYHLLYGEIRNFMSVGNEFQISNAQRLYYLNTEDFYSYGNTLFLADNSSLDAYTVLESFANTKFKRVIGKDLCRKGSNVSYNFGAPTFYANSDYNTEIDFTDPVTNIPAIKYNGLDITVDTTRYTNTIGASAYKDNNNILLYGKITRNATISNKTSIMQMPSELAINYTSTTNNQTINLMATSSSGNIVVLQYHYDTRYFDILSGESENDIVLTGLSIPPRR